MGNIDVDTILGIIGIIGIISLLLVLIFRNPFKYPYFTYGFDVSGKRNPQFEDLLDRFLIEGGFTPIAAHKEKIEEWKLYCQQKALKSIFKKLRLSQFYKTVDDMHAFQFTLSRSQTRYHQSNYVKTPYHVDVIVGLIKCTYEDIKYRFDKLSDIGFECTLREYHSKNQRKLATRELREKIMKRDNYTCQLCGKYMPDEVGLQIDHIVPVSKGGKSVPSNMQVLCSKCNSAKRAK